jgi:hypothetical protein
MYFKVPAGLVLRHGYIPEKHRANQTQNSHLRQCTVIPRLMKIILSGITFISRNLR